MKGSPVRVRASALTKPAGNGGFFYARSTRVQVGVSTKSAFVSTAKGRGSKAAALPTLRCTASAHLEATSSPALRPDGRWAVSVAGCAARAAQPTGARRANAIGERRSVAIAAFVVSVVAILIAGGSLWYTRRAHQRAERAERREVEARLEVTALGSSPGTGRTLYDFKILNASKAPAHQVRIWLVDEMGNQLHEDVPGSGVTLLPNEESKAFRFEISASVEDFRLALIWWDGAGEHVETRDSQGRRLPHRLPDVRRPDAD